MVAIEKKGRDLLECFEHFDDNGDGVLDERELRDGMERLGIELSPNETRSLMDRFADPLSALSDDPQIKYRDFVKGLNLPKKEDDSAEAEEMLRNELERLVSGWVRTNATHGAPRNGRHHVTMSTRQHVSTSARHHVTTSTRHHVNTSTHHHIAFHHVLHPTGARG